MKVEVIIPAGGSGVRFGGVIPKIFVPLAGRPLITHCLHVLEMSPSISAVIIAVEAGSLNALQTVIREQGLKKIKAVIPGGATRRASIENGLKHLDADTEIVMVHDAARPMITVDLVETLIADCKISCANVAAVEVVSTIKTVDPKTRMIRETLDRSLLWEIQTPQTFRKDILVDAYAKRGAFEPTDDASLVERAGYQVKVIPGLRTNLKITTPEDLLLAEVFLKQK